MFHKTVLIQLLIITISIASINGYSAYWNVPTEMCHRYGVYFNLSEYKIIQNTNDEFHGDKVTIFYSPGRFPYIDGNKSVNGGIPQKSDLMLHVHSFVKQIAATMPEDYKGVAILDFERYYPSYNISAPEYKKASIAYVRHRHPSWPEEKVLAMAIETFNDFARPLFQLLLEVGRSLRPKAQWGYYHYPYCHNFGPLGSKRCQAKVQEMNNNTAWLFSTSSALYPSIYVFKNDGFTPFTRKLNSQTRLIEALRVKSLFNPIAPIYPYFWYRYHDANQYLSGIDVANTLGLTKMMKLQGNIIWGSKNDVSSYKKCKDLKNYVTSSLGPLVYYISNLPMTKLKRLMKSKRRLTKITNRILNSGRRNTMKLKLRKKKKF